MTQDWMPALADPRVDPRVTGVPKVVSASDAPRTLPDICHTLRRDVTAFLEKETDDGALRGLQDHVRNTMKIIDEALQRYSFEELSLSYNGGKDCLVLLVLILACLPGSNASSDTSNAAPNNSHTSDPSSSSPHPLQAIYIAPPDPFSEVEEFVANTTLQYHLNLKRYALPMRAALEAYQAEKPCVKAIFMGTRRTDPHSEFLTDFSPTDGDWPRFMRINPILDWHYADIWAFIRQLDISFCILYLRGFSSLGGTSNTRPNPALAIDAEGTKFRPAYELVRDDEERLGRDR